MINWLNPDDKISRHFSVREAVYLPQWERLATEQDGLNIFVKSYLVTFFAKMDSVRGIIGKPVKSHVAFRPIDYNSLPTVKGSPDSAHMCSGPWAAIDFSVPGMTCDEVRTLLLPKLSSLGLRMEQSEGANWVHLDSKPVTDGSVRFFKV